MRVIFRVDGDPSIGLGHIMRCMALAQSLDMFAHDVVFFMCKQSLMFCQNRADWRGEIQLVPEMNKNSESLWLSKQCKALKADWLVLDGYQFDQAYRQSLASLDVKLAVFDDMNNSGVLHADMVINGALNAQAHNYQQNAPSALLAIGPKYRVLRQEFLQLNTQNWQQRRHLSIMFGGSDPYGFSEKVLQSLVKFNAAMPINIITGSAYDGVAELTDLIKNCQLEITHLHDCQSMAQVLLNTKLALSAAGGSQFELQACATPAILVVLADNQQNATQDALSQGWCHAVNCQDSTADDWVMQCLALWQQPALLLAMHQQALLYPSVGGAKNIVKLMSDNLCISDKTA